MTQILKVKNLELKVDSSIQTSPNGRPFRLSGIDKVNNDKWIGKELKSHWIYRFIFLDERGGFINFEFDYYDNYLKSF